MVRASSYPPLSAGATNADEAASGPLNTQEEPYAVAVETGPAG